MFLLAKYNTQTTFTFPLVKRGVVDLAATADWTPATGDTKISKDAGNVANTTNNPAAVGGTGSVNWSLTLTATELQAAVIDIQIVDSATKAIEDQFIKIFTYGNASAKLALDLSVNQTGDSFARIGAPVGVSISADVAGVQSDTDNIQTRIPTSLVSGRIDASVGAMAADVVTASAIADNAIDAGSIAADAITAAKIAADAIGSSELATTAVNEIRDAILSDSTPFQGARIDAAISSRSTYAGGAVASVTAGVTVTTNNDKTGYGLSAAAVQAIWDALTSALTAVGSIGKFLIDRLDAAISSRMATFTYTAPDNSSVTAIKAKTDNLPASPAAVGSAMTLTSGERTAIANEVETQIIDETDSEKVLTAITDKIASVNPSLGSLTLAAIASQVRTELAVELARIDAAISSRSTYAGGDTSGVTTLLARLTALRAAAIDNLDILVSSRLATAGYTAPDNAGISAVKAKTDNLPGDPADASDIAALFSTVNSTLTTLASYVDTEVAAIKAKTDNLPGDPADASDIAASFSSIAGTLATIAAYIDTEVAAIKAKTDLITAGSITVTSPVTISGSLITVIRGTTIEFDDLQGLGLLTGRDKLYFTVKTSLDDDDSEAILQIEETDGLVVLGGAPASTSGDGDITVDDATAGDITIRIEAAASALLELSAVTGGVTISAYYDVKKIDAGDVQVLVTGRFAVVGDVTRAVS